MSLRSERFKRLKPRDQALERIESLADLMHMYKIAIKQDLNLITRNKLIQKQILDALNIKVGLHPLL
jgi:hypothetical protein